MAKQNNNKHYYENMNMFLDIADNKETLQFYKNSIKYALEEKMVTTEQYFLLINKANSIVI
jgi:hypothetical protein